MCSKTLFCRRTLCLPRLPVVLAGFLQLAAAAEWQWSVLLGGGRAVLWIPQRALAILSVHGDAPKFKTAAPVAQELFITK